MYCIALINAVITSRDQHGLPSSDSPRPSSVGSAHSNQSSTKGSFRNRHEICVGEEIKISIDIAIERFRLSEEQKGNLAYLPS